MFAAADAVGRTYSNSETALGEAMKGTTICRYLVTLSAMILGASIAFAEDSEMQ
jgi:hypothetical protein